MTKAWEIKWHRISHRGQNLALNVAQNERIFLFVSLTRNIRRHQLARCPFNCLGHRSCWCIMRSFHSPVQTGGSPDAAAKGSALQTQKPRHLGAWAVLEVLWKPSEVKGEKGNTLKEPMGFLTAPICPKHAAKTGCEPLARSPTFPDKALCLCSRIRALKALHGWIL